MRTRFSIWLLLLAGIVLAPGGAFAQDVPPVLFTGPLSHPQYGSGGFYCGFAFVYISTNRPLKDQQVATRGFLDLDGSVSGKAGTFVGSNETALNVSDVRGPGVLQPGYDLFFGWRFENGLAVEFQWRHLTQAQYSAQASILPPSFNTGNAFENTFLFAPVTNFTTDWAGPATKLPVGDSAATFGIWNGASSMQIMYQQRFDIYGINGRLPIWEGETYRSYGLFGPRIVWIWDRFSWTTVASDLQGDSDGTMTAIYSNTISNRLYGVHGGFGNDWYLGSTPIGAFSFNLDVEGALYLDLVKTNAAWVRGDVAVGASRARRLNRLSPEAELRAGFWWYPWEGISVQVAYDIQAYFNTVASPQPIDFNFGSIDPKYDTQFLRTFNGIRLGINFVF